MSNKDEDKPEQTENQSIYAVQAKALGIGSESYAKTLLQENADITLGDANASAINRPGNEEKSSAAGQIGIEAIMPLVVEAVGIPGLGSAIEAPTTSEIVSGKDINATAKEQRQQKENTTELVAKSPERRKIHEDLLLKKGAHEFEKIGLLRPSPSMGHTSKKEEEERHAHLHR